jgi:hypothetical protein
MSGITDKCDAKWVAGFGDFEAKILAKCADELVSKTTKYLWLLKATRTEMTFLMEVCKDFEKYNLKPYRIFSKFINIEKSGGWSQPQVTALHLAMNIDLLTFIAKHAIAYVRKLRPFYVIPRRQRPCSRPIRRHKRYKYKRPLKRPRNKYKPCQLNLEVE